MHVWDEGIHGNSSVDSLKGTWFELAMLHKMVPEADVVLKRQHVFAFVQLKVEAI